MICLLQRSANVLTWANITCSMGVLMSIIQEVISLIIVGNYGIFFVKVAFYGESITNNLKRYGFFNYCL